MNGGPPMGEWPSGHENFRPGNDVALKHGAYSPTVISEKAAEVHAALLDVAPYLAEPKFLPAVNRYLQATAREALLHDHIVAVSADRGPKAVASRTWEQATAAARLAAKLGDDLGLSPLGHARIRSLSVGAEATEATLADLAAQGRSTSGWATYIESQERPPSVSRGAPREIEPESESTGVSTPESEAE